jgi:hypothetical protein
MNVLSMYQDIEWGYILDISVDHVNPKQTRVAIVMGSNQRDSQAFLMREA